MKPFSLWLSFVSLWACANLSTALPANTSGLFAADSPIESPASIDNRAASVEKIRAAINSKFESLDALGFNLGANKTDVILKPGGGFFVEYELGGIYWDPKYGAHEMHGLIFEEWMLLSDHENLIGFPVSDEVEDIDDPSRGIPHITFESGRIYKTDWGARTIYGPIYDKFLAVGGTKVIGFPSQDVSSWNGNPDILLSQFNHGVIHWTRNAGAHLISGRILDKWSDIDSWVGRLFVIQDEIVAPDGLFSYNVFSGRDKTNSAIFLDRTTNESFRTSTKWVPPYFWKRFEDLGGVNGPLIRPVSDVISMPATVEGGEPNGEYQDFVNGTLYQINHSDVLYHEGSVPTELEWNKNWTNNKGYKASGSVKVVFYPNGKYNVKTVVKMVGGFPKDYKVRCAMRNIDGQVFVTSIWGKSSDFGSSLPLTAEGGTLGTSNSVQKSWRKSMFGMTIECGALIDGSDESVLEAELLELVKKAGPILENQIYLF